MNINKEIPRKCTNFPRKFLFLAFGLETDYNTTVILNGNEHFVKVGN